jgi:hypothetical protein
LSKYEWNYLMYTYNFNPFNKPIEEIQAEDLKVLRNVSEGWYIEYKRESIKTIDFAKHLSSFSNQYGGFLFIGIIESKDGSRKADTFIGLSEEQIASLSLQIREAAVSHVNPPVLYDEHLVRGPCEEIGLPENKAILIIAIPQGSNPPYIHSSGRIYRRLADQSKPKEETDRYILDDLWKRGKDKRDHLSQFLMKIPELPKAQINSTWAFIYLVPNINFPGPKTKLSFDKFRLYTSERLENSGQLFMPMQSACSVQDGYFARHLEDNNPSLACPAIRWWHKGIVRLEIPINTYSIGNFEYLHGKHKYTQSFITQIRKQGFDNIEIYDLSYLLLCLTSLSSVYRQLLRETGDNRDIYGTYELQNVFYKLPFLDSMKYQDRCSLFGIPIIQDRIIRYPQNPYFDNMLLLPSSKVNDDSSSDQYYSFTFIAPIGYHILNATGVLPNINDIGDIEIWGFDKLRTLGDADEIMK